MKGEMEKESECYTIPICPKVELCRDGSEIVDLFQEREHTLGVMLSRISAFFS